MAERSTERADSRTISRDNRADYARLPPIPAELAQRELPILPDPGRRGGSGAVSSAVLTEI